jgi:hypothetical protein
MSEPKAITGRKLRQAAPEEQLAPGEAVQIVKRNGKTFELRRTDGGEKSITRYMEQLFKDVPLEGQRVKTDLVKAFLEDRE